MVKYGGLSIQQTQNTINPKQQNTLFQNTLSTVPKQYIKSPINFQTRTQKSPPKNNSISISSIGRLQKRTTSLKQSAKSSRIRSTSSSKQQKYHHAFERNLFKSRQNYLKYLFDDLFHLFKNKQSVQSQSTTHKRFLRGGNKQTIKFNISRNNDIVNSKFHTLLALDNLHDFAVGSDNNISEFFENSEELIKTANQLFEKKGRTKLTISTFEHKMFLTLVGEYSRTNPMSFVCEDTLREYYTKKVNVDGDIFVDTTPVDAYRVYDNSEKTKTLATYFDPSPTEVEGIKRYDDDIKLFNIAVSILKRNYTSLDNVEIELSTENNNNNFMNRKYIFKINKKDFVFSTGQNGDFTVGNIQSYIQNSSKLLIDEQFQNITRILDVLNPIQVNSLLVLMKALGDFSQLFIAFNVNKKTNMITTVDKWLFTIGLYCLRAKIFEKELFMLIGTGNTSEDKSKSRGTKILIYNDNEFFLGNKTLRDILEQKYKSKIKFVNNTNNETYIDLYIRGKKLDENDTQDYLIESISKDSLHTIITTENLSQYIQIFQKISFIFDISLEALTTSDKSNQYLASIEESYRNVKAMTIKRFEDSQMRITPTFSDMVRTQYSSIGEELKYQKERLESVTSSSAISGEIKNIISGMLYSVNKLLNDVNEDILLFGSILDDDTSNRRSVTSNKRARIGGKIPVKKTIGKKPSKK